MKNLVNHITRYLPMNSAPGRRRLWVLMLVMLLPVNPAMAKVQLATAGMPMQHCEQSAAATPGTDGDMNHHAHHAAATQMDQAGGAVDGQQECCGQAGCGDCSIGSSGLLQRLPNQLSIHHRFASSSPLTRSVEAFSILLYRPPISA
jgi:hypothetical protein